MQTSTTVVTSLKRVSADADALMVALESRIQSSAHALAVREESFSTAFTATTTTSNEFDLRLPQSKTNVKRDAKKADKHFRKGLELLRRRQSRRVNHVMKNKNAKIAESCARGTSVHEDADGDCDEPQEDQQHQIADTGNDRENTVVSHKQLATALFSDERSGQDLVYGPNSYPNITLTC